MAAKKASPAQIAARKLFAQRAKAGALKKNPAAKPKSVKRPSQATKKAPTKRLVARRVATKKAPPGYFANPVKPKGRSTMNYAQCYRVEKAYRENDWSTVGYFVTKSEAFEYAKAYNKANNCRVRVLSPEI